MSRGPLAAAAALGVASCVAGCVFTPVSLEGRRCATTADCVAGYECSAELICVLSPDVGRPDAGRPDANVPDVGRDASSPLDAPITLEGGADAPLPLDASAADDAVVLEDATALDDAPGTIDGGGAGDAGSDDGGATDARLEDASGDAGPDAP